METIIDAHAHVFEMLRGFGSEGEMRPQGDGMVRWADGTTQRVIPEGMGDRTFPAETYLDVMDTYHIERAVLLQGGMLGFENEYVAECVQNYPLRFAGAATFDPFCRQADAICDHLLGSFRIFKFEVSMGNGLMGIHHTFPLDGEMMMHFYEKIARKEHPVIAFDIGCMEEESNQPEALRHIAMAFPHLTIVICHLAGPRQTQEELMVRKLDIMRMSNIYFDLAALFWKTRPGEYPFPVAQKYAAMAKEIVGADHLMWGTDSPSTLCKVPMARLIDYLMPAFTPEEQQLVWYETAKRIYFPE